MTNLDLGVTGAKRVSFKRSNPRELLLETIKSHKKLYDNEDDYRLFKLFADVVMESDAWEAVVEYYFTNHIRAIRGRDNNPRSSVRHKEELQKATKAAEKKVQAVVAACVEMVLLDMMLPHGKTLRDSTGKECAQLGPKMGEWLTAISKAIKPHQIVGKALTEERVRALYTG